MVDASSQRDLREASDLDVTLVKAKEMAGYTWKTWCLYMVPLWSNQRKWKKREDLTFVFAKNGAWSLV